MATDPSSPITGVKYIPTLLPPSGGASSPESVKSLREYVKSLMTQKSSAEGTGNKGWQFYGPMNGISDASAKIMAGFGSRDADEREAAGARAAGGAALGLPGPTGALTPPSGPSASGAPSSRSDISGDFNPAYSRTVAEIESSGNPNTPPNSGGNRGLYQFGPEEERKYGLNAKNWNDPASQHAALEREYKEHSKLLEDKGLPVNEHNLYFTHQQGVGGGPALLNAPAEMSAWRVIRPMYKSDAAAKSAITGNIYPGFPKYGQPVDNITAGDFRQGWRDKFYNVRSRFGDKAPAGDNLPAPAVEAPAGAGPTSPSSSGLPAGALKFASAEIPGAEGIDHDFARNMIAAQIAKNGGPQPMKFAEATPLPPGPGPVGAPPAAAAPQPGAGPLTGGTVGQLGQAAKGLVPTSSAGATMPSKATPEETDWTKPRTSTADKPFIPPEALPKRPYYDWEDIRNRWSWYTPQEKEHFVAMHEAESKPMSYDLPGGGKILYNPANPRVQFYQPNIQHEESSGGGITQQRSYVISPTGNKQYLPISGQGSNVNAGVISPPSTPATGAPTTSGPQRIPPTQTFPAKEVNEQINQLINSQRPEDRAQGFKLRDEWNTKLNTVEQIERGGFILKGNPYTGYENTGIPSKPEVKDIPTELSGVGTFHTQNVPVYDKAGNLTGYRQLPVTTPGSTGAAGADVKPGEMTGKEPFDETWSRPQMIE
jgi:hypothetical protein